MAQSSTSPVPPRRTSRKVKPNINSDVEYDFVQRRINPSDRQLARALGLSPHVPHVASPLSPISIPSRQMLPVTFKPFTCGGKCGITAHSFRSPFKNHAVISYMYMRNAREDTPGAWNYLLVVLTKNVKYRIVEHLTNSS